MWELGVEFLKLLEGFRNNALNIIFEMITILGEEIPLIFLIVTLWFAVDKKSAQKLLFVTLLSLGVNSVIKNIFKIPRPFISGEVSCVRAETATGYSFPSGHTQGFSTWSTLFALYVKKRWFSIITAIFILLVGFSRMYLGAHYPADVAVGAGLGMFFALVFNKLYNKFDNKIKLYVFAIALLSPFAVLFMLNSDPMYSDLYKFYGMLAGLIPAVIFEEKYAPLRYDISWRKKIIRIAIGLLVAFVVNECFVFSEDTEMLQLSFLILTVKYAFLVFSVFGLVPVLFKRMSL